jgi:hypothetical protein
VSPSAKACNLCLYFHARKTLELVLAIATAPLGEEEGYIAISVVKALYRLKMSGAAWHAFLADQCLIHTLQGGYQCMEASFPRGQLVASIANVHTDNICAFLCEAKDAMAIKLEQMFKLKVE